MACYNRNAFHWSILCPRTHTGDHIYGRRTSGRMQSGVAATVLHIPTTQYTVGESVLLIRGLSNHFLTICCELCIRTQQTAQKHPVMTYLVFSIWWLSLQPLNQPLRQLRAILGPPRFNMWHVNTMPSVESVNEVTFQQRLSGTEISAPHSLGNCLSILFYSLA
jgi:hypothetical protein